MPTARIIVATYNQLPLLRRALRGYLRQTSGDFSLVVADDGSSDGTDAWLAEVFAPMAARHAIPFEHVHHEDRGFRKTRILNEAVRRAQGEALYVFSDGDCIPPAHFVAEHIEATGARTLAVGGAIRLTQSASEGLGEEAIDTGRYEALGSAADHRDLRRRRRKSTLGMWLRRKNRPKILGLNMGFSRDLFEALNGFDERFQSWGVGEDSDMRDRAMRMRPRPRVSLLYGRCDVFHLWHPRSAGSIATSRAYQATSRPVRCVDGLVPPPA